MLGVLIFFHFLFIAYFLFVKTWYFSLVPIFFLLFIIFNLGDDFVKDKADFIKSFFLKNLFILGWLSINTGLFLIIKSYLDPIQSYLIILAINIIFFLFSVSIGWKDGQLFSHFGLYFWELALLIYIIKNNWFNILFSVFNYFVILDFVLYSFIIFIVGSFKKISKHIKALWFFFLNLLIINLIYKYFSSYDPYLSLVYTQLYLLLLFSSFAILKKLYHFFKTKEKKEKQIPILEKILQGERVFTTSLEKKPKKLLHYLIYDAWQFINNLPDYVKIGLGLINLVLILLQIFIFIKNINSGTGKIIYEIGYWLGIGIFFINFLILKYLNFYHQIQRIFIFFILNFGIYLTILNLFGKNLKYIVIIGTAWNLINSVAIFFAKHFKKFLVKEDFYLWIIANLGAFFVNLYFISKLNINLDIKLGIITLYFGIQIFLTYYNFKFLNKKLGKTR